MSTKKLSWKPVRNGEKYCSPACGHDCTHVSFEAATKNAAALVERLGPGWKPHVWENVGWYFRATKNGCNVHYFGFRNYWAVLNFGNRQFHATGTTPKKAIQTALDQAKALLFEIADEIEEFEK